MEVKNRLLTNISLLIVILIGCQQFPVVRVGGSFKIYELLAALIIALFISGQRLKLKTLDFPVVLFFLFTPIISALIAFIFTRDEVLISYYSRFPYVADDFRYNFYIAVVFPCIYYLCSGFSFLSIANALIPLSRLSSVVRCFYFFATFIATISIITALLNAYEISGPIQLLPEAVQNVGKVTYGLRTFGFSQEPSFYVLYQGWVVLIAFFYRKFINGKLWFPTFLVNVLALFMTFSSALGGFVLSVLIVIFYKSSFAAKIKTLIVVICLFSMASYLLFSSQFSDYAYYFIFGKVFNFLSYPTHTLDSGSFRAFTNFLGLYIFSDHWLLGVGPGASIFYMPSYEHFMHIEHYGEELNPGSFPQNSYSSILAELGMVGFILMSVILISHLVLFTRYIQQDTRITAFAIGVIFTIASLFSIAPAYSMFIWVFIAFGRFMINVNMHDSEVIEK